MLLRQAGSQRRDGKEDGRMGYLFAPVQPSTLFILRTAKIILIPKPGKDCTTPEGYRPISLLPGLGKIYERVILHRMEQYIARLPPEQFGFRKGLSTTKQLVRLAEFIGSALYNNQKVALLMLDVAKAFDRVWHEGLIFKLISFNFQREMIQLIYSFIKNRNFFVSFGNDKSDLRYIRAGIAQGSILGPVLYLFYVADFPNVFKDLNNFLGCYADDTALAVKSLSPTIAINKLQEIMPHIEHWCTKWRIAINADKSQLMIISKKISRNPPDVKLKLFDTEIPLVTKSKYLGVTISQKFTWTEHIKNVRSKAYGTMKSLMPMLGRYSQLDLKRKRHIYTAIVRPIMCYASPVWATVKHRDLQKIQVLQNKFLRLITDAHYFVSNETLHRDLKIEYIKDFIHRMNENFFKKALICPFLDHFDVFNYFIYEEDKNIRPLVAHL
ncbi:putative RNA-directed DNA polymerase from transposon BS, partial [Stegodyphus mimosarum]